MSLDVNISEPEEFNCVELHSCIKEVSEIIGVNNFEYHVDCISNGSDSYIANLFRVNIKDIDNKDNNVSVIVKTLINTARRELFHDLHKREVLAYKEVITKFEEIQKDVEERQKIFFPRCLYTNELKNNEVIILKDMKDYGFGLGNVSKYENLSLEQVRLILNELAKFHALSYVYEQREKENFDGIKGKFGDLLFHESFLSKSKLLNYFFESYDMSLKLVSNIEVKNKLEKIRYSLLGTLKFFNRPSEHGVLCHGDLWINNILFKDNPNQDQICFLDFQAMRYCCPVIDIIYFIFLTTTSKFRSEHLKELQEEYYDTLKSHLELFNIDANIVYPKERFEKDLEENLPYGLLTALIELRIVTTESADELLFKEYEKISDCDIDKVPGEIRLFYFRVNDVVEESVDNGVLEKLLRLSEDLC